MLEKFLKPSTHPINFRLLLLSFLFSSFLFASSDTFDSKYQRISSAKVYKKVFEERLLGKIKKANHDIIKDRIFIKKFFSRFIFTYSAFDRTKIIKLSRLAKKYRIKRLYDEKSFLEKVDAVPVSLALAQAAIESAWGKSRFSREANNIFGEWTYGKDGLVPQQRSQGLKHKIRIFKTLDASIKSYMLNLNRHNAYKEFRKKRLRYRKKWLHFGGIEGSSTMGKYSGIGKKYNVLIAKTINQNGWSRFD